MLTGLKNTKSLLTVMICLAYAGLFFSITINNILLGLLLVFCLLNLRPIEILQSVRDNMFPKILIALFIVQIIGLTYSDNFNNGLFILEKKASFLLIPLLLFPLFQKTNIDIKVICRWIGIITIGSSVVLFVLAVIKRFFLDDPQAFFYEEITSIHYVYYSIYFATGSLILIDSLFDSWIKTQKGIIGISILFIYSFAVLVIIASKTGIGAFCVVTVLFLYKRIPNKRIFGFALLAFIVIATLLFYFNTTTRARFTEMNQSISFLLKDDFRGVEVYVTDLTMRLIFWKISITQLFHDNLFWAGVGTGDAQDYLNYVYTLPQYDMGSYLNWDAHNEWIFTFIQLGIMGLIVMIFLFGKYLIKSFQSNDLKFLTFLIVTGCFSVTESILESNKGIVFFALLFTLFAASYGSTHENAQKVSSPGM